MKPFVYYIAIASQPQYWPQ